LKSLPGVAEVAASVGMVKQYQVLLDPHKLAASGVTQAQVREALQNGKQEAGGAGLDAIREGAVLRVRPTARTVPCCWPA
jgi:Cu(I)/Ag(I) efflux system membrane protein CusA/SilA